MEGARIISTDATIDLPKAVNNCRAYEQSTQQLKEMSFSEKNWQSCQSQ